MRLTIASAVNDDAILKSCLLSSPDLPQAEEVLLKRGFTQAAAAYNEALSEARGDVIVLLHQDVYLPAGWLGQITGAIDALNRKDPAWGVLGAFGITNEGTRHGHLYCTANRAILGGPFDQAQEVSTLDEVLLVIRKDSGLRFDENLKGFHFYGTDICLTARNKGMKSYAIPSFCVHNANEYGNFPQSFWSAYFFERHKWKSFLPVRTPCVEISESLRPYLSQNLLRRVRLMFSRKPLARRVESPAQLYNEWTRQLS
jgi:glycosyltransferase involved in cell wall biosynthesis